MEHNQNLQKFWFFVEYQRLTVYLFSICWPFTNCSCCRIFADSRWWSPFLMIDTTFFVEETDQKTWILTVNIGLKHPKKDWFHRTRRGIWGWPMKLLPYVAIIFPHPKQLFSKKISRSLPPPIFHLSFPWFSHDFSPFHHGFPMGFCRSRPGVPESPGRWMSRLRGGLREASHATTGHVLGLRDAAAPPWGQVAMGRFCGGWWFSSWFSVPNNDG